MSWYHENDHRNIKNNSYLDKKEPSKSAPVTSKMKLNFLFLTKICIPITYNFIHQNVFSGISSDSK